MLIAALSAVLLLAQATAAPAEKPATTISDAKPKKEKKRKLICEDVSETGSFISKRVCKTPEQIEAERQASRATADDVLDRAQTCRRAAGC